MKLLFIGHSGPRNLGGIARTAQLVKQNLELLGWEVEFGRCRRPPRGPYKADVVWVYGETDKIPEILRAASCPVIINMPLTHTKQRFERSVALFDSWKHPRLYMGTFTHGTAARHSRLLALPKQIRSPAPGLPFAQRKNIFLGDLAKNRRPALVGGFDVDKFCALARARVPQAELVFVEQYTGHRVAAPKHARVIPYTDTLMEALATYRTMCSLVAGETFAMIPAEAQACGTPVIYRHMPQSLTEYFGHSAVCARDEQDMADWLGMIYNDEAEWTAWSGAGINNARAYNGAQALSSILKKVALHG